MFYNWKYCSFYPKNFGASALVDKNVDAPAYNLAGQRVNDAYKGIVVKNGKKYMNK